MMLVRNRIVGFFVLITCPLLAENEAQASAELRTVQSFIQKTLVEKDIPSLAVAVARNGEIIWEEAWGMADRENQIPATPHTMYSLASISN